MTHICWQLHLGAVLAVGGVLVTTSVESSLAQNVTLDGTLGPAQTINGPNYTIPQAAGQTVDGNLFHSFGRFSLNTGESAIFQSAADVRNILSRVTGGLPSRIDGLIDTQSNSVNLYLINPSGIVFGPNAQLNVGGATRGSFVATTADAIGWSNGSQFSATNPSGASSLLTIVGDPSGFLFNRRPPQAINVDNSRLSVAEGQSLVLLGGNINLNNSLLVVDSTVGGSIELGAVGAPGTVGLTTDGNILSLDFPENLARADVSLTGARVNVLAEVGGSININARNLNMQRGSQVQVGLRQASDDMDNQAGNINVITTGDITLQQGSVISAAIEPGATGNAGNINIITNSLRASDGGQVNASSFGRGNGGNVTITASDAVAFDGVGSNGISSAISYIDAGAEGNGGNVNINARSLTLTNGGQVSASVRSAANGLPGGIGNAGNVVINVRDAITIQNSNSGILSILGQGAVGSGGSIEINTGSLTASDGGQVSASSFGRGDGGRIRITASDAVAFDGVGRSGISSAISYIDAGAVGNGGNVEINARSLTLTNGGQVSASVRRDANGLPGGRGNAGNVEINVRDTVTVSGRTNNIKSGILSLVGEGAEGSGGNISLNTTNLTVRDEGEVTVSNRGMGDAGIIMANARNIFLDNQGQITATSELGEGGNVTLQVSDVILLRRNSLISHFSGRPGAGGTGGIFRADAGFIVAVPSENSDIITNAFNGSGGNIIINAQNIFGLQFQPQRTPGSDIVASGTVTLNTLNVDPIQGLVYLPASVDNPAPIAQSCAAFDNQTGSQFTVTGRGGLPASPNDNLSGDVIWSDTRLTSLQAGENSQLITTDNTSDSSNITDTISIQPASGWIFNHQGEVTLVQHTANNSAADLKFTFVTCPPG